MDGRGLPAAPAARIVIRPEDLQGAARLLTRVADPRAAVCLAASWMLRADVAELWEPADGGSLRPRDDRGGPLRPRGPRHRGRGHPDRPPFQGRRRHRWTRARRARAARSQDRRRAARPLAAPGRGDRRGKPRLPDDAGRPGRAGDRARRPGRRAGPPGGDRPADGRRRTAAAWPVRSSATWRPPGAPGATSRWPCSTSTTSRPSTTPTDTRRATCSCATRRAPGAGTCARATCWPATAARSSSSCCPRRRGRHGHARDRRVRDSTPGVTASAGVAMWDGREPAAQLIRRADGALYEAKRSGRDRTVLAAPVRAASLPSSCERVRVEVVDVGVAGRAVHPLGVGLLRAGVEPRHARSRAPAPRPPAPRAAPWRRRGRGRSGTTYMRLISHAPSGSRLMPPTADRAPVLVADEERRRPAGEVLRAGARRVAARRCARRAGSARRPSPRAGRGAGGVASARSNVVTSLSSQRGAEPIT